MTLEGKTIVVTGANSGIGAAIARACAAQGANVVIDYVSGPDAADSLVAEIEKAGGNATDLEADITDAGDRAALIECAVDTYGRLDVWINNAGIETRTSLLETTEADYDKVMGIDLRAAFFSAQAAAKQFISQGDGGLILNISSVHEDWPMPNNIPYCLAKGGMRMMTRTAGLELGPHGIRMLNVAPGAVDTPINDSTSADPEKLKKLQDAIPLGTVAKPSQIGDVVAFLCSDAAAYMTASTVVVDGGIMQGSVGL